MKSEITGMQELHLYNQEYLQEEKLEYSEIENMTHHESGVETIAAPTHSSKLCPSPDVVPSTECFKELKDIEDNQENCIIIADTETLMNNNETQSIFVLSPEDPHECKNHHVIKHDDDDDDNSNLIMNDSNLECDTGTKNDEIIFIEEYVADFFKTTIPENASEGSKMECENPSVSNGLIINNSGEGNKEISFTSNNDLGNDNELQTDIQLTEKNDNYLPDLIPARAENKNGTKSLQQNCSNSLIEKNELKVEQADTTTTNMNDEKKGINNEENLQNTVSASESEIKLNSKKFPLRSALKKGSSVKKNLRVSFSDCEKIHTESEIPAEDTPVVNPIFEMPLTNWDQWEAFSSIKFSLDAFSDSSDPFRQEHEKNNNSPDSENIFKTSEKPNILESNTHSEVIDESYKCSSLKSSSTDEKPEVVCEANANTECYQALTEANLKQHERLLLSDPTAHRESDSESSSSQDTIILMTSEESKRNQESIELSQRRYKQQTQGGSSSSSHDSEESLPQNSLVARSNSSIRRSLERTALRRSLTRCAEIRRKIKEKSVKQEHENDNSSLMEKLRILTEECDLQENQTTKNENLQNESNSGSKNSSAALLPRLDLQQVQTLMNGQQSIHKFYAPKTNIDVPRDVRQWKLHSKLTNKNIKETSPEQSEYDLSSVHRKLNKPYSPESFNGQKIPEYYYNDDILISQTENPESNFDELEQFVQQDQDRIERIRKRYSIEENEYAVIGFYRRPSVRGIRPKFGSTTQIIKQLQQQINPPLLVQRGRSHFTWPYIETSNNELPDAVPSRYLPTMAEVEEPVDTTTSTRHLTDNNSHNNPGQVPLDIENNDYVSHRNSVNFAPKDISCEHSVSNNDNNSDEAKNTYQSAALTNQKNYVSTEHIMPSIIKEQNSLSPPPYIPPPNPVRHMGVSNENLTQNCQSNPFKNSPNYVNTDRGLNGKIISRQVVKNGVVYFALDV